MTLEEGKTSMAHIRMNCYAYGLPFEPLKWFLLYAMLGRKCKTNSFRTFLLRKEIEIVFFFVKDRQFDSQ